MKLPQWLVPLGVVAVLIIGGINTRHLQDEQNRRDADSKILIEQTKQLSSDNKALGEQNERLSKQNQQYIQCIAELFARYTREGLPIFIEDLAACKTRQEQLQSGPSPNQNINSSQNGGSASTAPPSTPSAGNPPGDGNPPPEEPSLLDQIIDILPGLP